MSCSTQGIQLGHEPIAPGSLPVVTTEFLDTDDLPATPSSTTVTTTAPDGTVTVYATPDATITNPAVGEIRFTFPVGVTAGWWTVTTTGTIDSSVASSSTSFYVETVVASPGCQWPIIEPCDWPAVDDEVKAWARQFAVEVLWAFSGRQFGVCQTTIRPCRKACTPPTPSSWFGPGASLGWDPWGRLTSFRALMCGQCATDPCACDTSLCSIELWHKRVCSIDQVQIDGVTLAPSEYARHGRQLIRLGDECWPECQDWTVANGAAGSWSVTYTHGRRTSVGGQVAAGVLSAELALSCIGSDECQLPRRVREITREGTVVGAYIDPMTTFDKMRTGIDIVDMWLTAVNPNGLARRARAYRIGAPRGARVR